MKVTALLSEAIQLPHSLHQEIYQTFVTWIDWLIRSSYQNDQYVVFFMKDKANTCRKALQQPLQQVINQYIQRQFADHHVTVKISFANTTFIQGKVDHEWHFENYKHHINLTLIIPSKLFQKVDLQSDEIAIHWTSVAMHEILHLVQIASNKWKTSDISKFRGEKPNIEKVDYYTSKLEIDAFAQSTATKLIAYADKQNNPIKFLQTVILPKVKQSDPLLLGPLSNHRIMLIAMDHDLRVANKVKNLYYKKLYQKLDSYIDHVKNKGS